MVHRFSGRDLEMPSSRTPCLYLVVGGALRLHTPSGIMDYVPGQCSASSIDTPDRGYVLAPSGSGDFVALSLAFTLGDFASVMTDLDERSSSSILESTVPQEEMELADRSLVETFARLVDIPSPSVETKGRR
ncbi:MAG: AraC family transcriptional regulator N-terminal domain-containing protein [Tractidigestivibacter sp.]|uniref:AraC family transcriptional regulator N-terminal domain-containing protein n=1 Tax=Tractidigestivibacter sp. TaxID=2847320 RepID=UPI003D8B6BC5